MAQLLIVEDELVLARQIRRCLESAGHEVRSVSTGAEALVGARQDPPDLVLLDLRLPDGSGLDVLEGLREHDPELLVVLMTGHGSLRDAVEAIRKGACEYLQKPLDLAELEILVERLLARQRRERELAYLRDRAAGLPTGIVSEDPRVVGILEQARRLAQAGLRPGQRPAILLTGETGTGKGIVASAIHAILGGGPFIEVNCTAMPATLVESELFGHERGSFTDARSSRPGLFEAAHGGSIFLDEVGELDVAMQAKFLKVIEDKRVRRLGATRDREIDVQVMAATHRDLDAEVAAGRFRADLLHRLRVLAFEIPPLRERPADVRRLARHFAELLGQRYRGRPLGLSPDAEELLLAHSWPGNVRELRNVIERTALLGSAADVCRADLAGLIGSTQRVESADGAFTLPDGGVVLEALERDLIRQALARSDGNRTRAAALLGLTRDTLRYRMEKYGLD